MRHAVVVRDGYNAIAARYMVARAQDSADVALIDELLARLPKDAKVLDAGCGAGVPITRILSRAAQVTGVDFAEAQIALARENVPDADFICRDMTALDFPDASFDAIVSYYAIIHIPRTRHRALLENFYRMLKPNGDALLCLGADDLEEDFDENYLGARMYWSHFDAEENVKLLHECGFEIVWAKEITDASEPTAKHLFVLAHKGG